MKAFFSSLIADRWQTPQARIPADLPVEAPLEMPVQAFDETPGRFAVPDTSPSTIGSRRAALIAAAAALTLFPLAELLRISSPGGIDPVEAFFIILFLPLFAWIAFSFCSAVAGFWTLLLGHGDIRLLSDQPRLPATRTAVLIPIYNEDVDAVFRRLSAMTDSAAKAGPEGAFDFFILSDSTEAHVQQAERIAFDRLCAMGATNVYYRHRPVNTERKPGNIAEWVRRFGSGYEHMIVLDADSLMSGKVMLQLVDAMERHPGVGLIQTVPTVANGGTLFSRWQQFASRLYGPVSTAGLVWWTGAEGSFWGHNAIIRVRAFAESCGLPALSGRAPFGGTIMSHDIVEAALLRRRGWAVHMVTVPDGSFEEFPPTLIDLSIRDRRWCQGNLQHLQLLGGRGMHWVSRLHLLMGASSYLTSPLWALLLCASLVQAAVMKQTGVMAQFNALSGWLLLLSALLLLGPKMLSVAWALMARERREAFGGTRKLLVGVLADFPLAALFAPAIMVTQIIALAGLISGRKAGWKAQRRDVAVITAGEAMERYRVHVATGMILCGICALIPGLVIWMLPVIPGLLLAPLIVVVTSRRDMGLRLKAHGIFLTPEEIAPSRLLANGADGRGNVIRLAFTHAEQPQAFKVGSGR